MKKRLLLLCSLLLISCGENVNTSINGSTSSSNSSSTSQVENITISKSSIIGLPLTSYDIDVNNNTSEQLQVVYGNDDFSYVNASIVGKNKVNVKLLAEGKGYIIVKTNSTVGQRIDIESIDLKIINQDNHLALNTPTKINLSKNVEASFSVEGEGASITSDGVLTVSAKSTFLVKVIYGDIVLSKEFDSYDRFDQLTILNRNNEFIKYHGRNVHKDNKVIMNNIGSGFEVKFYGTKLYATFDAWYGAWYGKTKVSVLVDDEIDTNKRVVTLNTATTESEYLLVDNLPQGIHTVKVLKRTEALSTSMTLHNIRTDGYFKIVDKTKKLTIEAYGDSITAGYGNLRGDISDTTNSDYQDGLQTYATYAATSLNADINVQARSGIGMYTSNGIDDTNQVNSFYNRVNYDGEYYWNFDNYTPDLVFINLGTNDFWNPSVFNLEKFKEEYSKFIVTLANIYGSNTSFILMSGLMENNVNSVLPSIIEDAKQKIDNEIHYLKFDQCREGHPRVEEHKTASEQLVKYIKDHHLDINHPLNNVEKEISDIKDQDVNLILNVETLDELPEYCSLYLNGFNQKIQLTRNDTFKFSLNQTLKEGDYLVKFNLNDNDDFKECGEGHLIKVREDNNNISIKLDSFVGLPKDDNKNAETNGWEMSSHLFEASFTTESKSQVSINNSTNYQAAFVFRDSALKDNYKISTTITSEATITNQTFIGLCPYYKDDLNYIVVYLQWETNQKLKSIGCTGYIDGNNIGWNDFWNFANLDYDLTTGETFMVERNGTSLTVHFGNVEETKTLYRMNKDTDSFGLYAYADKAVNYANISQEESHRIENSKWSKSACLFEETITVKGEDEVEVNNYNNWMAGFALTSCKYLDNYIVSSTITAQEDNYSDSNDAQIALVPYFADDNNFIVVYLQWQNNKTLKSIGLTGKIDGVDLGWNDMWSFQGTSTSLVNGQVLKVTRKNTEITAEFNGVKETKYINKLDKLNNYAYGVWCHNTVATFKNIKVESI